MSEFGTVSDVPTVVAEKLQVVADRAGTLRQRLSATSQPANTAAPASTYP